MIVVITCIPFYADLPILALVALHPKALDDELPHNHGNQP